MSETCEPLTILTFDLLDLFLTSFDRLTLTSEALDWEGARRNGRGEEASGAVG